MIKRVSESVSGNSDGPATRRKQDAMNGTEIYARVAAHGKVPELQELSDVDCRHKVRSRPCDTSRNKSRYTDLHTGPMLL